MLPLFGIVADIVAGACGQGINRFYLRRLIRTLIADAQHGARVRLGIWHGLVSRVFALTSLGDCQNDLIVGEE